MRTGAVQRARRSASIPCRSLPSSSAQGCGNSKACTDSAPSTVSRAKTGIPRAESSRSTSLVLSEWLHGTCTSAPMAARPVCPRLSSGVAVYPQRWRWLTRKHSALRKMAPTLKAERRWSMTTTRGMRCRPGTGASGPDAPMAAPAPPGQAGESARPTSSGRSTRNSSSRSPRVCCRSTGKQIVRKCRRLAEGVSFGASELSSRRTLSSWEASDPRHEERAQSNPCRKSASSPHTRSMRCICRQRRERQATRFLRTLAKSASASATAASTSAVASSAVAALSSLVCSGEARASEPEALASGRAATPQPSFTGAAPCPGCNAAPGCSHGLLVLCSSAGGSLLRFMQPDSAMLA
mmetsp:Transcript_51981/g.151021  ORF Transcript_51981/g.151021 Transcript_51981/m.151021 type:complete len:352 (+) Transcript_51981:333-1388(+)